jgi:TGF-beta propeptide
MRIQAFIAVLLAALALGPARADGATTIVAYPAADLGLPFSCSWGYDWDERCYTDDGPRLPIGGVDDKVWRSAIRFPLAQIPAGASVAAAELRLWYDGVCVAPRKTSRACDRGYAVDVRRILSADWRDEREVELDEEIEAGTTITAGSAPGWLRWDVTGLVDRWHAGDVPNYGLLLGLAAGEEDFDVSGPYLPSMSYPDAARRPRLVVTLS